MLRVASLRDHVRPAKQFVHDWMHVMAVHGVINVTLFLALNFFNGTSAMTRVVTWEQMHDYVSNWFYPQTVGGGQNPSKVLNEKRVRSQKKARRLKCQARECIALLPVVACFVATAILPGAEGLLWTVCMVVMSLADVQDLLEAAPRGVVTRAQMNAAVEAFLAYFKDAFGTSPMITKFHSMLHFGRELHRNGMALSCFVQERKHYMVESIVCLFPYSAMAA